MSTFFAKLRNGRELLVLIVLDFIGYFVAGPEFIILFSLGFVWNWVASKDLSAQFEHRRYRFTTLKTVVNLQSLILKPIPNAPSLIKLLARSLPAGIFWGAVMWFNESHLPLWSVFLGSLTLEALKYDFLPIKEEMKESP